MDMPELFGNAYMLPAIIVVVVLLLLLVIIKRRDRSSSPAAARSSRQTTKAPPKPADMRRPTPVTRAAAAPAALTPAAAPAAVTSAEAPPAEAATASPRPTTAAPAATPAVPAEAPAVTSLAGLRGTSASLNDPLRAVIMDILQGWGDLTPEDTKRITVFRPEKILEATEKIALPKDHTNAEHARLRLNRIRQHATNLLANTKPVQVDAAPAAAGPAEVMPLESAGNAESSPAGEPAATQLKAAQLMAEEAATAAEPAGFAAAFGAAADGRGTEVAETVFDREEAYDVEDALVVEAPASLQPIESAPPSLWAEEVDGWEASEPLLHEETDAWEDEEVPSAETRPRKSSVTEDMTARARTPEDSLSSLHLKIRTADDLMALPSDQRADMLVFLGPAQLSRVFQASDDAELKKAVVDTLEHVGNPSALEILRRCLDDPDPGVQVYALEAADRLLGVD